MNIPHRVVIVGFPPAQMLDIAGPVDAFSAANDLVKANGAAAPYEVVLAAPEVGLLRTSAGFPLVASISVHDPDLKADTLILAGGEGARRSIHNRTLVDRLRSLCKTAGRVGSVCTGSFPLAATGLLNDRRTTTHWAHFGEFCDAFPSVLLDRDALFIRDGKYQCSAGVSAGIDSVLALIEEDCGRTLALQVARELVVYLKRPGGQSQFSSQLATQFNTESSSRFAELLKWMASQSREDLSVQRLAARVAMSPRNFHRRFTEALGTTPANYVQTLRLDEARRLLTDGTLSIERIAARSGYASSEAMRAAFQRHLQVSPSEFRLRFRSTGSR
ncbi:GlxA family transcriptional regulator [Massilia sp. H6]|uniref:GlxA family transcriptional regulator n=1 Tax=Massilia sp. H6 TaxID=2970464 RepID=UPI00216993F2|nr:helix-turn-helix domain-containing protein [Massilia sp. H6]UVW29187.1 helix-turn-helix domain-containing protein [Massilia sp. H6]